MGHKVSRHKSYSVCRVDGLPGQYRVIRQPDTYDAQPNTYARNYGNGENPQSHNLGVTADRKYVTSINDIGSKGIRTSKADTTQHEATTAKVQPKPKPRKKKDINSNEKANGDLSKPGQTYPTKQKHSPHQDTARRKSNGSVIHESAVVNPKSAQSNKTTNFTQDRPQRVLPRATPVESEERKPKITPRTSLSVDERRQRTTPRDNSRIESEKHREIHSQPKLPVHVETKSNDDENIPISNVDAMDISSSQEQPSSIDIDTSHYKSNGDSISPHKLNDTYVITSYVSDDTPAQDKTNSVQSDVKDADNSHHTLVSVVVHQPFTKPEPTDIPEVVLNGDEKRLSDHKELDQRDQIMLDDEPVDVSMFERASSSRSSQVKKSVAFSDECIDIEEDLSQSYSRNGFHEKMDSVYGTTIRQNGGDKWVTLDGNNATDFTLIQRQKVPGQSILKKSKYPPNEVPTSDPKESVDKNSNVKSILSNRKSDIDWDHIEDPSNPYPNGMVPVPAPRGRMKGYHRPQTAEMAWIKATNGTLADYIKQTSANSHQATNQTTSNSVTHNKVIQNGGTRPQSSRGHTTDMSPRIITSPRSASADPRSRALSPTRVDTRGRIVLHDGQGRKVMNGYVADPSVHYANNTRGREVVMMESRSKNRHAQPQQKQNVKLVINSGKQKSSKKPQHKHVLEQPKQHRNMVRQQWMVGNL
ncbi:uncharacterized protein [Argopecten irradians]|uniref:uncharacterized protein n=1 Tax=Argopecten irradians TaxID=31199 RepID=UPI00371BE7F1